MQDEYFQTSDLGLAATLHSVGFNLKNVDKSNPKRVLFNFENTKDVRQASDMYWENNLLVSGISLMESIKQLKSRIYSP